MNLPSGNSSARRSKALVLVSADAWPVVIWGLGDGMLELSVESLGKINVTEIILIVISRARLSRRACFGFLLIPPP